MITNIPLAVVAAVLGMVLALPGLGQDQAARQARKMVVRAPDGWYLSIGADGSAAYGYGADLGIPIAAGTFDLESAIESLQGRLRAAGKISHDYAVTIWYDAEQTAEAQYAPRLAAIDELFAKARKASDDARVQPAEEQANVAARDKQIDHAVIEAARKELFRRELREGVSLVITQEPMTPAEELELLAGAEKASGIRTIGYFSLSAELVTKSGRLRIWSRARPVEYDGQLDSYEVLDALALPDGRVIIVIVGGTSLIEVIEAPVAGPSRGTFLGDEWSQLAAALPHKPGRLSAELSYDEQGGTVHVVITDRVGSPATITRFEQKQDQWAFLPAN